MLVAVAVVAQQRAVDGAGDDLGGDDGLRGGGSIVVIVVGVSSLDGPVADCAATDAASSAVSARRASPEDSRMIAARASGSSSTAAAESARVGDRAVDEHAEVVVGEQLERQQQRPRQQRRDDRERGVLGGRRDEDDPAVLDAGQQRVLLGLREAVDLVEEQHRRDAVEVAAGPRLLHDLAHVAHAGGDGRELDELAARRPCAIACASVVLPVPGGPQRMTETEPDSPVRSPARATSGDPGVSRCRCPATSSRLVGRMRTASGVAPERSPGLESTMPPSVAAASDTDRSTRDAARARAIGADPARLRRVGTQESREGACVATNDRQAREERARLRTYQARQEVHVRQAASPHPRQRHRGASRSWSCSRSPPPRSSFYFSGGPGTPEPEPPPRRRPTATPPAGENQGDVPSADLAEGRTWTGTLTLNDIPLGIELDGAAAPQAVSSEISLIQSGFYDGTTCHRLTTRRASGCCSAATRRRRRPAVPATATARSRTRPTDGVYPAGTIAMARQPQNAYSQGSQFFIVYEDTTLPADEAGGYTVVGHVTSGLDELTRRQSPTPARPTAARTARPPCPSDRSSVRSRSSRRPAPSRRCNRLDAVTPPRAASDHDRVRP